jgi:hypothetical protein
MIKILASAQEALIVKHIQKSFDDIRTSDVTILIMDENETSSTVHFKFFLHKMILSSLEYFSKMLCLPFSESKKILDPEKGGSYHNITLRWYSEQKGLTNYAIFKAFFGFIYSIEIPTARIEEYILQLHSLSSMTLCRDLIDKCEDALLRLIKPSNVIDILLYINVYRKTNSCNLKSIKGEFQTSGLYAVFHSCLQTIKVYTCRGDTIVNRLKELPPEIAYNIFTDPAWNVTIQQKKVIQDEYGKNYYSNNTIGNHKEFDLLFKKTIELFNSNYLKLELECQEPFFFKETTLVTSYQPDSVLTYTINHHYIEVILYFSFSSAETIDGKMSVDFQTTTKRALLENEANPRISIYICDSVVSSKYTINDFATTTGRQALATVPLKPGFVNGNSKEFGIVISIETFQRKKRKRD